MNGAESLVHTLLKSGVDTCFANPGTSEMHFVAALDRIPGMHCVLGLQENVVTGMADGYYRIAGKPACTLLHCGPGLANGLANLHNARRARSGIVNVVGDQATYHRPFDAPLTADTESLARAVSTWVRTSTRAVDVGRDAAAAVQAARTLPGQIATLILPSDTSWDEGGVVADAACGARRHRRSIRMSCRTPRACCARARTCCCCSAATRCPCAVASAGVARSRRRPAQRSDGRFRHRARRARPRALAGGARALRQRSRDRGAEPLRAHHPGQCRSRRSASSPIPASPRRSIRRTRNCTCSPATSRIAEAALQALVDELDAPAAAIPDPGPRPAPAQRRADAGRPRADRGGGDAGERDRLGRERHATAAASTSTPTPRAPHDWLQITGGAIGDGLPRGDRRGDRLRARQAPRAQPAGRRLGDVFAAGAVDAGARAAAGARRSCCPTASTRS